MAVMMALHGDESRCGGAEDVVALPRKAVLRVMRLLVASCSAGPAICSGRPGGNRRVQYPGLRGKRLGQGHRRKGSLSLSLSIYLYIYMYI